MGYPRLRGFFSQRMAGHLAALVEAGLPIDNDLVVTPAGPDTLGEALSRVMAGETAPKPTAFFSASAEVVFHLIDWLRSQSIDVPGQVSVVGYDDWPMFEYLSPGITTVTVCPEQVGRLAVREVLAQAEVGVAAPHTRLIPPKLIVRQSSAPPASRR